MHDDKLIIPSGPNSENAVRVDMSMQIGSILKRESGETFEFRVVSFKTSDGHEILYPWDALKATVVEWMKIEQEEITGSQTTK